MFPPAEVQNFTYFKSQKNRLAKERFKGSGARHPRAAEADGIKRKRRRNVQIRRQDAGNQVVAPITPPYKGAAGTVQSGNVHTHALGGIPAVRPEGFFGINGSQLLQSHGGEAIIDLAQLAPIILRRSISCDVGFGANIGNHIAGPIPDVTSHIPDHSACAEGMGPILQPGAAIEGRAVRLHIAEAIVRGGGAPCIRTTIGVTTIDGSGAHAAAAPVASGTGNITGDGHPLIVSHELEIGAKS